MDSTYGEFQGTDLDPSADWDYDDDFEDEGNNLLPILGASVALAAVVGGILVLAGRRRNPTPGERIEKAITQLDKRSKKVANQLEKSGSKGLQAVQQAAGDGKLKDKLEDAIVYSRKRASDAGQALEDAKLAEVLAEARDRARKAAARIDLQETSADVSKGAQKGLQQGVKKARRQLRDLAALEAAEVALQRARKAASQVDVGDLADEARKRAGDVAEGVRDTEIDPKGALTTLRERVADMVDTLREDVAPKAVDTAQSAVDKVREDVLPATQDRVSQLVEETGLDEKAARAAKSARRGAESLSDVLRTLLAALIAKLVDEILPEARKAGDRAVKTAREEVIPAVADTAGDVAQRVREDVLPRVGEAAEKTPDMLSDLLKMARERADEVLERAQPVASDAAEFTKNRAEDLAEFSKHRAEDVAEAMRGSKNGISDAVSGAKDTASSVGSGITGGISSAGKGVKSAVGGAVNTTTRTTKEAGAIAFWLAALGALILLVFVPDRDKQQEMWNSVRQFLGEVREMWRDLQGEDYELETPDTAAE
jgi:hypothetical protein